MLCFTRPKVIFSTVLMLLLSGFGYANNLPPLASFSNDVNRAFFFSGETITFDGSGSIDQDEGGSNITYYRWRVDGVIVYQGSSATHFTTSFSLSSGQNSKTVQVQLEVRDDEFTWTTNETKMTKTYTIRRGQDRQFYLKDHLGSVRVTVDEEGEPIGYDDYYPFGLTMPGRSSNSANPNDNYKFTGHERDDEAGLNLYNANARMYDPVVPRFLSIDPLHMERPGLSPYNYVQNNPVNRIDPTGLLDEYYDQNGNYLGSDELETDNVWITTKENYTENVESGGAAIQENSTAITDAKLSLEGWSNLFTDVFSKMGGSYRTEYLQNGKIAVANYENRDAGMGISQEVMVGNYNGGKNGAGLMTAWMSESQHAILTLNTFYGQVNSQLGTVANIQNTFVHEFGSHYNEFLRSGRTFRVGAAGEIRAYTRQMNHPTFSRTTPAYQNFIRSNCKDYGGCN